MGASSARSKVQLGHGITSGATLLTQLSPSFSITGATLSLTYHQYTIATTQATLACLHMRTHARIDSTSVCLHALVRLCYGHKHLPKQTETHEFMPEMSVGDLSR